MSTVGWRFWQCRCGAVLLSPDRPTFCPRGGITSNLPEHRLASLATPQPFDYLVLPGACWKCGGEMVAIGDEVADALPRAQCAACGWTWFIRSGDVAAVLPLARRKKTGGG